jgi:hypothetical protein
VRFKPTSSSGERPQTYVLDRAATGPAMSLISCVTCARLTKINICKFPVRTLQRKKNYFPHNDKASWEDGRHSDGDDLSCCPLSHDIALCGRLLPTLRGESVLDTRSVRRVLERLPDCTVVPTYFLLPHFLPYFPLTFLFPYFLLSSFLTSYFLLT